MMLSSLITANVGRYVSHDRVANFDAVGGTLRRTRDEAHAPSSELLPIWSNEAYALALQLEARIAIHDGKETSFASALRAADEAATAEIAALAELEAARELRGLGSIDRDEALRQRDDVDAAESRLSYHSRARADAVARTHGLPQHAGVPGGEEARDLIDLLWRSAHSSARHYLTSAATSPDLALPRHAIRTVRGESPGAIIGFDMGESEIAWIPLFATRTLASELAEVAGGKVDPSRVTPFEEVKETAKIFIAMLAAWRGHRLADLRTKAEAARRAGDAASEAARLAGAETR